MHAAIRSLVLPLLLFALLWSPFPAQAGVREDLQEILEQDTVTIDLARAKLELDRLVDPSVDVDAGLAEIDAMAAQVRAMLPPDVDTWSKVEVLRRFIYEPGPWNEGRFFAYDMADPYGGELRNKLLTDYLADRRGNCVTMPVLFVILGQRLGLEVTLAQAPLHVLIKLTDDEGQVWNLEATSGAGPARDDYYREVLPITDESIASGLYLRPLSPKESVALLAEVVIEHLIEQERYMDAIAAADLVLDHAPRDAHVMVKKGHAAALMIREELARHGGIEQVPATAIPLLNHLVRVNQDAFNQAEILGWIAFDPAADAGATVDEEDLNR